MNGFNFSSLNVNTTDNLQNYRKEKGFYKSLVLAGVYNDEIQTFAEIRYYRTQATNYACFWIHSPILGLYGQTGSKAGGYGYNREEAAIRNAAEKHGIITPAYCDDRKLLESFAAFLGLKTYTVIVVNS